MGCHVVQAGQPGLDVAGFHRYGHPVAVGVPVPCGVGLQPWPERLRVVPHGVGRWLQVAPLVAGLPVPSAGTGQCQQQRPQGEGRPETEVPCGGEATGSGKNS